MSWHRRCQPVLGGSAGDVSPREGTARCQRREGLSQGSALPRSRVIPERPQGTAGMERLALLLFSSWGCKVSLWGGRSWSKPLLRCMAGAVRAVWLEMSSFQWEDARFLLGRVINQRAGQLCLPRGGMWV